MFIPGDRGEGQNGHQQNDYTSIDESGNSNNFGNFGSLRRSLRQMNPFKSKLFRLPATPRLTRKPKGNGNNSSSVETTGWNFERPSSVVSTTRDSNTSLNRQGSSTNISINNSISNSINNSTTASINNYQSSPMLVRKNTEEQIKQDSFRKGSVDNALDNKQTNSFTNSPLKSASFRIRRPVGTLSPTLKDSNPNGLLPPPGNVAYNNNNYRLSYNGSLRKGQFNEDIEAQKILHEHMKCLQMSPALERRQQNYQRLPNNTYGANGEVYDVHWRSNSLTPQVDANQGVNMSLSSQLPSPCNSTISLLGSGSKNNFVSGTSSVRSVRDGPFQRQPLTNIFARSEEGSASARSSMRVLTSPTAFETKLYSAPFEVKSYQNSTTSLIKQDSTLSEDLTNYNSVLNITQLFTLEDFTVPSEMDTIFVGREWLFKELYRMSVVEKTQYSLIEGANGSGKSSAIRQIILQSPFFSKKNSNGDTVDSGIVLETNESPMNNFNLSTRNYEWLRQIANRVVAYHNCRLYSSYSCAIPEFICNLTAQLTQCSQFSSLANYLSKPENSIYLNAVSNPTECCKHNPIELFKKAILEPIKSLCDYSKEDVTNCCIILIDSLDEADFHRLEEGESLAWFLSNISSFVPPWIRFILTSTNKDVLCGLDVRSIHLDDAEMDERITRDCRLLIENSLNSHSSSEDYQEFVDKVVHFAQGNMLFIYMVIDLIDRELLQISGHIPNDISQLYFIYFKNIFGNADVFEGSAPVFAVLIASLRPLKFNELLKILNAGSDVPYLTEDNLTQLLASMIPLISRLNNDSVIISHQTFREWIIKCAGQSDYIVDVRYGHILHALSCVRQCSNISSDQVFELAHHLLKANPHKYMKNNIGEDMPNGRDSQLLWLQMAANSSIKTALLYPKNTIYPNSKVSRLLLLAGADANVSWPHNQEPLIISYAKTNNTTMIDLLLKFGADVECKTSNGTSPLIEAAKAGNIDACKMLLEYGANFYTHDENGHCALVHSAMGGYLNLVSFLLEDPVAIALSQQTDQRNTSILYLRANSINRAFEAAASLGQVSICKYLLDCTDSISDMSSAMCAACTNGQSETVQFLLSRGANLSVNQYWNGKSSLICAIESGSYDLCVNVLSGSNIDINNDKTENGFTPLIIACRRGHVGLVDLLINRGMLLDTADCKGRSAVMHAIICKHASTAALLIDRGCNVKKIDNDGNSLLHLLAEQSTKCLFEKLLECGLSLEDKNNDGLRPIEVAIKNRNRLAIDAFLRKGARLRATTWKLAIEVDAELSLILIKKLLDDASFLLRRKLNGDAMHRFHYALARCNELLEICCSPSLSSSERKNFERIVVHLKHYKLQILFAMARLNRKNGNIMEAVEFTTEALQLVHDNDDHRFELHLLRAKCFFDGQNVSRARRDIEIANNLKPGNIEAEKLLSILSVPNGSSK